jgi:urease accessory protein
MFAHIESNVGGWWSGVLHPMEGPDHLVTMLLVGLLGGLAVRAGRSSWTLPTAFAISMAAFGPIGTALDWSVDLDPALIVLAALLGVMVVVHPRRTTFVAPVVVVLSGSLHGLAHSNDMEGISRPIGYMAGFTFTAGLLLIVGAIVGATAGRWMRGRQSSVADAVPADVDEGALV